MPLGMKVKPSFSRSVTAHGGVSQNGAEHVVLGGVFPILTGLQMGTRGPGRLEMPARTGLDRHGEAARSRAPRGWEKALSRGRGGRHTAIIKKGSADGFFN